MTLCEYSIYSINPSYWLSIFLLTRLLSVLLIIRSVLSSTSSFLYNSTVWWTEVPPVINVFLCYIYNLESSHLLPIHLSPNFSMFLGIILQLLCLLQILPIYFFTVILRFIFIPLLYWLLSIRLNFNPRRPSVLTPSSSSSFPVSSHVLLVRFVLRRFQWR